MKTLRRIVANTDPAPASPAPSAGTGTDSLAGLLSGRPCDPLAFRRLYPDRWSAFLHAQFRNHVEVAVFFSVNEKTARQWWEGVTGPQGWASAYAVAAIPGAAAELLRRAA